MVINMKREDVIYNIKLSFDFYFREVFCKKYGFFEQKEKSFQRVAKNKKYQLDDGILLTDGNGNCDINIEVKSNDEVITDYIYNANTNTICFNKSLQKVVIKYNVISVDVVDYYPEDKSDDFEKQMIAISMNDFYTKPFDVVGRIHKWEIPFYVDMFLFSRVIRNRIASSLSIMFKSISMPIIDFINNGIINDDGTINKEFSFEKNSVSHIDKFGNISLESMDLESLDKKKMYSCSLFGIITVNF